MIKILYVVPNLFISSGVTTVIMNYFRKIDRTKYEIDFLVIKEYKDSVEKELLKAGCKIFYLKNKINLKNLSYLKKEILDIYCNNFYDIIELHAPTYSFLFMKLAKKCKIPVRIIHTHSTIRSSKFLKNIFSFVMNIRMKSYANVFFSCSQLSGYYWYGHKICKTEKFFIISNAIDSNKFKSNLQKRVEWREKLNINNNIVIGYVGRLSIDKNLFFLIDVFEKIIEKNYMYKLVIVGDGLLEKKIKDYSIRLKDNIIFLGNRNDIFDILNCFDIFVLVSKREGLPMTVVEAQFVEVPCMISDTITKEVDLGNVKFIPLKEKKWIDSILNFQLSKNKIIKDKFDIDVCANKLEKIYDNLYNKYIGESRNGI